MKRTLKSRFAAALSAFTMLLASCADKKSEPLSAEITETEYVYKSSYTELSDNEIVGEYDSFSFSNGKIYFLSEKVIDEENGISEYYLNITEADGTNFSCIRLGGDNSYITSPAFAPDGTGYYIEVIKNEDERTYLFKTIDESGKELSSADITEFIANTAPDFYPYKLYVTGGNIFISDYNSILIIDTNGKPLNYISDISWIENIISDKNGCPYVYIWSGSGNELCSIDITSGELGDAVDIPFDGYGNYIFSGSGYDFFLSDGTSLFGYDIGGEKTEILNWISSGVSIIEVSDIFYMGDEKFICAGKSFPYNYPKIHILEKQIKEATDRKEIILACTEFSIDGVIENSIVKFNSTNDKYYITVKKYLTGEEDKLDLDIISGNMPDILFTGSYTPTDNYISKGLFADMYEFIDNDSELSREDFVPNLLRSAETNGKLYRFTDRFKVYTVLGKESVFGSEIGSLTIDKLNEIISERDENVEILPALTKNDLLTAAMEISGNEYIDLENRKCRFDSESFVKILEHADRYITEQDYDNYFDSEFWERFNTMFADESALLMTAYLTDYADIYRFEKSNFGERVTAVGFPCENGNGSSFVIDTEFSISADSDCKEGAWEFIRTLLLPEHQDSTDCFAVRKDSLEKAAAAAMKHDPDSVNYAVVIMGNMSISAGARDIGEPSEDDIRRVNDIISSTDGIFEYDTNIMDIIHEEAASYFVGKSSSKDTAARIQARVRLYLDEKS